MKLKTPETIIDKDDPFKHCKLDRKKYGIGLTRIVENYSDGFVLAINNEWGTGKTTFLQMWQQMLINEGFRTVYFNAWECDYETNPLAAILSELREQSNSPNSNKFDNLITKGAAIVTSLLPAVVNALTKKYIETEVVQDAIKKVSEDSVELFKNEISEYLERKKSLSAFRKELASILKDEGNGKALIFIVDELDRCRPDFAVKILENIKHLFSVDGVIFVLSIDKVQLSNAINGYYGSSSFDSTTYLKRFIDIEFHLPRPDISHSVELFLNRFDIRSFYREPVRHDLSTIFSDYHNLLKFTKQFCSKHLVNLRSLEKLLSHFKIALTQFRNEEYVFPEVVFFLVYLRNAHFDIYCSLQNREIITSDLVVKMDDIYSPIRDNDNESLFINVFAHILVFYNNDVVKFTGKKSKLISGNGESLTFSSGMNNGLFLSHIYEVIGGPMRNQFLSTIMNKIDFTYEFSD